MREDHYAIIPALTKRALVTLSLSFFRLLPARAVPLYRSSILPLCTTQ